jgi:hypothetical protein
MIYHTNVNIIRGDKLDFYTYDEDKSVILGFFRGFVMHVLSIIAGLGIALFVAFLISLWNPFFYNTSLNIALFTYGSATFVGYFLVRLELVLSTIILILYTCRSVGSLTE